MWAEHVVESSSHRGGTLFIVRLATASSGPPALAGSHVTVAARLRGAWRYSAFSVAGVDPTRRLVTLIVRRTGEGGVSDLLSDPDSVGRRITVRAAGDRVSVPSGRLQVLVAGSGAGPALGLLSAGTANAVDAVDLHFYGSGSDCGVVREALTGLVGDRRQLTITLVDTAVSGRLRSGELDALIADFTPTAVFTCGPTGFMDLVVDGCRRAGLDDDRILVEEFVTAAAPPAGPEVDPDDAARCVVDVFGARHEITWPATEPLLNALLRQGIDVPFSCRAGICSACQCRVVTGQARMSSDLGLSDEEKDAGLSLACQLFATSPAVSVHFS